MLDRRFRLEKTQAGGGREIPWWKNCTTSVAAGRMVFWSFQCSMHLVPKHRHEIPGTRRCQAQQLMTQRLSTEVLLEQLSVADVKASGCSTAQRFVSFSLSPEHRHRTGRSQLGATNCTWQWGHQAIKCAR